MAWKFPIQNTRQKSPTDIETVNDNIHEFTAEAGNLNEHNWSATISVIDENIPVPITTEARAALQIHHDYFFTSHAIGNEDIEGGTEGWTSHVSSHFLSVSALSSHIKCPYGPFDTAGSTGFSGLAIDGAPQLKNKLSWQSLHSLTGNTQSATMWLMCSFLLIQRDAEMLTETSGSLSAEDSSARGSAQFALRYNGSIIWETATGTAEPDNDYFSARELHGPCALTLDALLPVVSGEFRLELVGRCPDPEVFCPMAIVHSDLMAFEFRR